jgi:hypothetical protein
MLFNIGTVVDLAPDVKARLEELARAFGQGIDVRHSVSLGSGSGLAGILGSCGVGGLEMATVGGLGLTIFLYWKGYLVIPTVVGVSTLSMLALGLLGRELHARLEPILAELYEATHAVTAQASFGIDGAVIRSLSKLAALGVATLSGASRPTGSFVDRFRYSIKDVSKTADSLEWVVKTVVDLLGEALEALAAFTGYKTSLYVKTGSTEVNEWMQSVMEFVSDIDNRRLAITPMSAGRFFGMSALGNSLFAKYGADRELSMRIVKFRELLERLRAPFAAANFEASGFRLNPMTASIYGAPGKGKSLFAQCYAKDITLLTVPDEKIAGVTRNPDSEVYAAQPENVYWNGYNNQWVTVFDDFLQIKDSGLSPDGEVMKLMRCAQDFPANLHMADIASKGNTFFRSRIIILTTNAAEYGPNFVKSINCPEALRRRIDLNVRFCIKPQYATPETAGLAHGDRKLDARFKGGVLNRDIWELQVTHQCGVEVAHPPMSYKEFLGFSRRHFFEMERRNLGVAQSMTDSMREALAMRNEVLEAQMDARSESGASYHSAQGAPELNVAWFSSSAEVVERLLDVGDMDAIRMLDRGQVICDMRGLGPLPEVLRCNVDVLGPGPWRPGRDLLQALNNKCLRAVKLASDVCETLLAFGAECVRDLTAYAAEAISGQTVFGAFYDSFKTGLAMFGVVTLVLCAFRALTSAFSGKSEDVVVLEDPHAQSQELRRGKTVRAPPPPIIRAQMSEDPPCDEAALCVNKNNFHILCDGVVNGCALAVGGYEFLIPHHYIMWYLANMDDSEFLVFENCFNKTRKISVPVSALRSHVKVSEGLKDLSVFSVPRDLMSSCASIMHKWMTVADLYKDRDWTVRIDVPREERLVAFVTTGTLHKTKKVLGPDGTTYEVNSLVSYEAPTRRGDCGRPLFVMDKTVPGRKIAGVHVAGREGAIGFSVLVSREEIEKALDLIPNRIVVAPRKEGVGATVCAEGNFMPLGRASFSVRGSGKSCYEKSPLFEAWTPSPYDLAVLKPVIRDGVLVDPFVNAIAPYGVPSCLAPRDIMSRATYSVAKHFCVTSASAYFRRVLSYDEAVCGIEGMSFMDSVNRSSSAGYPLSRGGNGKYHIFGHGQDFDLSTPKALALRAATENIVESAVGGVRLEHYYTDFLKDERRKKEKVELVKTRMISGAPLAHTLACRMYFSAFIKSVHDNAILNGTGLGMNVYSEDWDILGAKLRSKGPQVFDGDFTHLDASESVQFLTAALSVMDGWYGDDHGRVREVLFEDVKNSLHVQGSTTYEWLQSNPSGQFSTSVVNTIIVHILFRAVWVEVHGGNVDSLSSFDDHVYVCVVGDDNITNVSDEKAPLFNQVSFAEVASRYGFKYTPASKNGVYVPTTTLEECTFLKRKFRYCHVAQRTVAPLELSVILEMPYWRKKGASPVTTTLQILETSYMELALHGKEVFDLWFPRMRSAAQRTFGVLSEKASWKDYLTVATSCQARY